MSFMDDFPLEDKHFCAEMYVWNMVIRNINFNLLI